MKIFELREGDKFKSTNPEIEGEGICIAHKIINGKIRDLFIIWDEIVADLDERHFWWNRDCELISSGNDVSKYQKIFNLKSKEFIC